MRRAVYLDFSIPLFEKDSNLKNFSHNLKDLSRYISKTNNTKFYISITLEFLTTFKDEISPLMESLKSLVKEDRVEFVVRDSFDIDSLKFPKNVSEFNFIFNEYLLGYFFGDKRNFEGDPSIMIKNLSNIMPYSGIMRSGCLPFLKEMGYSNFFINKAALGDSSFIYNSDIFVAVDFNFSDLFTGFVDKELLNTYILQDISYNYMVYYVNPYSLFIHNPESFNINTSNLFHLIDLTDKIEYKFADEYFEMPVKKELVLSENLVATDNLLPYQIDLSRYMMLELPESFDLSLFDDLRNVSLWDSTGNKLIDEYLRTSFLMLTLLSNSISTKINLLNRHLVAHISSVLDELEVYTSSNLEFKKSIQNYRSYINQK
jgi:hypothetical protein